VTIAHPEMPRINETIAGQAAEKFLKGLESDWRKACEERNAGIAIGRGFMTDQGNGTYNLGLRLRLRLLQIATGRSRSNFIKHYAGSVAQHSGWYKRLSIKGFDEDDKWHPPLEFYEDDKWNPPRKPDDHTSPVGEVIARVLKDVAATNVPRSNKDFCASMFCGEGAPRAFLAWLCGDEAIQGDEANPVPSYGAHGGEIMETIADNPRFLLHMTARRRSARQSVVEHLDVNKENSAPIISVTSPTTPDGLTAFARHIWIKERANDSRPWLYLPVTRGRQGAGDCRFADVVSQIHAFYANQSIRGASPRQKEADIQADILEIRTWMATKPAVLLLDGAALDHDGPSEPIPQSNIIRFIRDEPLLPLLWQLARPIRLTATNTVPDPHVFGQTRIVVLGDIGLAKLLPTLCAKEVTLELPGVATKPSSGFVRRHVVSGETASHQEQALAGC
jgi:hypothetical protein